MHGVAKIQVVGVVGSDLETKATRAGAEFGQFLVDVLTERSSGDDRRDQYTVLAFGPRSMEKARSVVRPGSAIFVSGRPSINKWQPDKGPLRTTVEIMADDIVGLGATPQARADAPAADDLPF